MALYPSSVAAAVGAGAKNVRFQASAQNLARKILVVGTYDPAKTAVVPEVPVLCQGSGWAAATFGDGYMLHRLILALEKGAQGIETWVVPQEEPEAAVQAAGEIDFDTSDITQSGTLYLYIGGDLVPVSLLAGDADTDVATKVAAAITANTALPVTAVVATAAVTITAKTTGTWGNGIAITFNQGFQQASPAGLVAVVTEMTAGAGTPDIQDALDALGTGDEANGDGFTDGVHGYLQDDTTLDVISTWNGEGNEMVGLYEKLVARPIRFMAGDTLAKDYGEGDHGLDDLITLAAGRVDDRTNGIVAVPGSPNHPNEIAATAIGVMARVANTRVAESYIGQILSGVLPGAVADRWTADYVNRDTAVKNGISPTLVAGGSVLLQNVCTFYHPEDQLNGYRSMRNIAIVQNLLANVKTNFQTDKWKGIIIVSDVAKVSNSTDRQKARDIDAVMDDVLALTIGFEGHAWIFSASFTVDRLKAGGLITIRSGGVGFDIILPVVLSGEGGIFDSEVQFDASLAVMLG